MKINMIFLVLMLLCGFITSCSQNNYAIKNPEYKQLIDTLRYAYTLNICYKSHRSKEESTICDYENLNRWNKSIDEYRNDSIALKNAIKSFYSKDSNLIKYLKSFKKVKKRIPNFDYFSNINLIFYSGDINVIIDLSKFYSKKNNAYLDLILNYYVNTDQTRIKLLLNCYVIKDSRISAEDLYGRLDKIFEKYGYEDKEKIRVAILEDFGSCITLDGM
ncbi:MAG: hypothetical protein WCR42_08535 [bacterium]